MEKTANYQLNQWDKTDRILMEDFNADNVKLEQVLLGKLNHSQLIKTTPTSSIPNKTATVDLSDVNWADWDCVVLAYDGQRGGDGSQIIARLNNGQISAYCTNSYVYFAEHFNGPFLLALFPRHDAANTIHGISIADVPAFCVGKGTFSELTAITFVNTENYSDTNILVWGVG